MKIMKPKCALFSGNGKEVIIHLIKVD